jgi:hypothetical protein
VQARLIEARGLTNSESSMAKDLMAKCKLVCYQFLCKGHSTRVLT